MQDNKQMGASPSTETEQAPFSIMEILEIVSNLIPTVNALGENTRLYQSIKYHLSTSTLSASPSAEGYVSIEQLLALMTTHGGEVVSTTSLDSYQIDQAKAGGRMYISADGASYVWMPTIEFPQTVEAVKSFEQWFPLDAELPEALKSPSFLFKRKPSDIPEPSNEAEGPSWKDIATSLYSVCQSTYPNFNEWAESKGYNKKMAAAYLEQEKKNTAP